MKRVLAVCLCTFGMHAQAQWTNQTVQDIFDDVETVRSSVVGVRNRIDGNISTSADELKRQLDELNDRGVLIKSAVEEILVWLDRRRAVFEDFKGANCGAGTPCADFRRRLRQFAGDMSSLRDRFPVVEKVGLGEAHFGEDVVEALPPFLLFGFKEAMDRVAGWEDIPLDLIDLFDEIDDPEAFSISFSGRSTATQQSSAAVGGAATGPTPTEEFCADRQNRVDRGVDPVSLNDIKRAGFALKTAVDVWSEFMPESVEATVVGMGTKVPLPAKGLVKMLKGVIEVVQFQVETHRQNLETCRSRKREAQAREHQIEGHLAGCLMFAEYKKRDAIDEAYDLVERKWKDDFQQASPSTTQYFLRRANNNRSYGRYGAAFKDLCDAYQALGE